MDSAEQPLLASAPTNLPVVGLTLAIILCIYLGMRAYKEYKQDSHVSSEFYADTGIDGSYNYKLPIEEMVCSCIHHSLLHFNLP